MPNRLSGALSPYLEQHANNPVDWYPWGEEAFAEAKRRDCPILLSIGYSACHWCHVMERESFQSVPIADQMNASFVSIKVDREERPDLDQIYQAVVQRMGRGGGWPLTVFLTPERRPFFAGTYFPPTPKFGMPSFPELLESIETAFRTRRRDIEETASELTLDVGRIVEALPFVALAEPVRDVVRAATPKLLQRIDPENGGFGDAPKFPNGLAMEVLLRAARRGEQAARGAVRHALEAMQAGGIHDQIGGGFCRYSTDARWRVPHFEKMLDQNALLLRLYAEGFRAFGEPSYRQTIEGLVAWLDREMTAPDGRFFASQDADSAPPSDPTKEPEEGAFFTWTRAEIDALVPELDREAFCLRMGIEAAGNWKEGGVGACVPYRAERVEAIASLLGASASEIEARIARASSRVLAARLLRPRPFTDQKIVTSWNGLLVGALAEASMALGDPSLLVRAQRALTAFEAEILAGTPIVRASRQGQRSEHGFLDDHADLAFAALDVFEATAHPRWLSLASTIVERTLASFWDEARGVVELAPIGAGDLIARPSDVSDQATPSGAATLALLLLRLGAMMPERETRYRTVAERIAQPHAEMAVKHPFGLSQLLLALDRLEHGSTDVVVVGEGAAADALLDVARRAWLPARTLLTIAPGTEGGLSERLGGRAPSAEVLAGGARAYVCRGHVCELPVGEASALSKLLEEAP